MQGLDIQIFRFITAIAILFFAAASAHAQSSFNITSATYGTSSATSIPATSIPAGINGVVLELGGTLPTAAQQTDPGYQGCFYTGYGSTTAFPLSAPDSTNTEPLTIPASTIQSIPESQFTAANGYAVTGYVYFVPSGQTCDGEFNGNLTNRFPVSVIAPSLGAYLGPLAVPQTNSVTGIQAAPTTLSLPASGFFPSTSTVGSTTVKFGTLATVSPLATSSISTLSIPVPPAFSSSAVGTSALLSVCNTIGTSTVCITPDPAITITVVALVASSGTITATPSPVSAGGKTQLMAQFRKAAGATGNPGAPAGQVTFTADGATILPEPLVLDTTATFASQTSAITTPTAATPTFTPVAGSYLGVQTITIADTTPAATIYYSQDGTTPTTASTAYTAPFTISTSKTIKAIAAVAGSLNSAIASVAYVVTVRPATHLAFQVQPSNTALNTAITPAIQVALLDSTNAVVSGSTAAVTIAIGTNPRETSLAGTRTVNAVNGIATFSDLSIPAIGNGFTFQATSGTLPVVTSNAFNITPPTITMTVQSTVPAGLVGIGATLNGSFTLGVAAPAGGQVVNLTSGTPANVTISPASVTVPAGQKTGAFTYTGVAAGSSTLSATSTGYQTGTVATTATAAQVSLGVIPAVAPGQTQSLALSLATAAPAGGTTVTFTIANTNIATVTSSVFVPGGQFTAATNPQVAGVLIGTTTVTANGPGYAPATRPVNVTVTATFNPGTTYINLITSTNTLLQISAPAPAGGIRFNLTSSDPTKATVPASVTVIQGGTNVKVPITGVADGTVTIAATSTGITEADGTVVVNSTITSSNFVTGFGLENYQYYSLPVSPSTPTNVTIKVSDPTVALISTSQSAVGQQTVLFSNLTSSQIGYLYIQGKKVGTTTLTISAPGYTSGTETITVSNSGFAYYYGNQNFTTTTYASPTTDTVYPFVLDANGSVTGYPSILNPGTPALSIPITSSDTSIGTVTSPIVFHALDTQQSFTFTPKAAGTANLTIGAQPTGFMAPMLNGTPQYQTAIATVNTPAISAPSATTGVRLQGGISIYLPVAPPNPITVTVTMTPAVVGTPLAATISKTNTVAGTTTQMFTNVTSSYVGSLYVQGQSAGTATITVSAPGYTSGTNPVTVQKSGFAYYYGYQNFNTTSFSGTNTLTIYPFLLDGNNAITGYPSYTLNPGVGPVTVPLTDSDTSVGTISANSVVFNTNDNSQQFTFQPVSAGTANITIGNVTGFTTPTTYQQATATVTAPAISVNGQTTGAHFQQGMGIYLPVAPPSARTVTVTTSAPGIATLSKDNVTAGTTTLTFTGVTSTYVGTIYVQGQSAGTATITESATGYVTGTSTLTVRPSGFGFYPGSGNFTTTTFSSPNTLTVYPIILDPDTKSFTNYGYPLNPGVGPITIPVTDASTDVGTISSNAVVFNTNDTYQQFTFKPVSAGTASLTLGTPAGFTTPSNSNSVTGTATVTAPVIQVSDSNAGLGLETGLQIYLPVAPPNPITVTVKSNGPLISLLSKDATTVGSASLTFTVAAGATNVGTIYLQGQSVGATTLKVSAPGYTDGDANITVYNAGFSFYYGNSSSFTTSVGSNPTQLAVYPVLLNAGTLTPYTYNNLYISPGAGTVNVPVTSSSTAVGTVVNPLVFAPGASYGYLTFTPVATGTSTLTIGTPSGFSVPTDYTTSTATVQ